MSRYATVVGATAMLLMVSMAVALRWGYINTPMLDVLATIANTIPGVQVNSGLDDVDTTVLLQLRAPRVVLAALVGGLLAISGAAYQGVFRNPLADPYLLGAASGAGLGATLAFVYAPGHDGWSVSFAVPVAAFIGAIVAVSTAYFLGTLTSRTAAGSASLLLAGIAVSAFLNSIQTMVQQINSDDLRAIYAWLMGQFSTNGSWDRIAVLVPYAVVSVVVILASARYLDLLAVGEEEATTLGRDPRKIRLVVLAAASLATAAAVAAAGLIGFVGLVVPHVVRSLVGSRHVVLLPVSLLGGATFMVLADLLARTVAGEAEIPIGVVTAFVGAPFFAFLLLRRSTP